MKRVLALFIAVAMLLVVVPVSVAAEDSTIKNVIYLIPKASHIPTVFPATTWAQ